MQTLDVKKTFFVWFRLVLSSIAFVKKAKENDIFSYLRILGLQ